MSTDRPIVKLQWNAARRTYFAAGIEIAEEVTQQAEQHGVTLAVEGAPRFALVKAKRVPQPRGPEKRGVAKKRGTAAPAASASHDASRDRAAVEKALLAAARQHVPGTLLLVQDVRAATGLPKERFDAAVMALSRDGRAVVHHHDHPMALSAAERDALVWSPRGSSDLYAGTYYIGIAPRSAPVGEQIRASYLRLTGGKLNQYVRLAPLRAEISGVARDAVDAELIAMQQRSEAILYPIDDPQRLRSEDNAAALRVSGERRDLLLLR